MIVDNGLEFAEHKHVAKPLKTDIYFADPYASYQRGANKNTNGLLRQYIPKGTDLRSLTDEQLTRYQQRLNLRPRKTLSFKQPSVIFNTQLQYTKASVTLTS